MDELQNDVDFDIDEAKAELSEQMGWEREVESDPEESLETADENDIDEETEQVIRQAPQSWGKEHHETWAKLPPEAQEYIELREKQMLDGIEQYKEGYTFANELRQTIEPYRDMFNGFGVDEKTAVHNLLGWNQVLTSGDIENRQQAFIQLGRDLGIIPNEDGQQKDPYVMQLEQRLNSFEGMLKQQQEAKYNAELQENAKVVEAFAREHEHFDAVEQDMLPFIQAGLSLQEAYDRAVWANPVTRALEQEKAVAASIEKRKAEADKAAKLKSANIRPAKTSASPNPARTMDETLSAAYDRIASQ